MGCVAERSDRAEAAEGGRSASAGLAKATCSDNRLELKHYTPDRLMSCGRKELLRRRERGAVDRGVVRWDVAHVCSTVYSAARHDGVAAQPAAQEAAEAAASGTRLPASAPHMSEGRKEDLRPLPGVC
jgi:hypothetical protein